MTSTGQLIKTVSSNWILLIFQLALEKTFFGDARESEVSECIDVLLHMQQYFSYICDGTDVQADWRSGLRLGSQCHRHFVGFFNMPSKHWHGATEKLPHFSETAPFQSPFTTRMGIERTYSRLKLQRSPRRKNNQSILSIGDWKINSASRGMD